MWLTGRSKEIDEDRQHRDIFMTLLQCLLHTLRDCFWRKKKKNYEMDTDLRYSLRGTALTSDM